ncbi:MAG: hypothetical protein Q9164_004869 [Protoblastenia rupestris]
MASGILPLPSNITSATHGDKLLDVRREKDSDLEVLATGQKFDDEGSTKWPALLERILPRLEHVRAALSDMTVSLVDKVTGYLQ